LKDMRYYSLDYCAAEAVTLFRQSLMKPTLPE
jgi:hypothetical protein